MLESRTRSKSFQKFTHFAIKLTYRKIAHRRRNTIIIIVNMRRYLYVRKDLRDFGMNIMVYRVFSSLFILEIMFVFRTIKTTTKIT